MNEKMIKFGAGFMAVLVVLNIVLFSFGKISVGLFWIIIALAGVFAYVLLPRLKKGHQ